MRPKERILHSFHTCLKILQTLKTIPLRTLISGGALLLVTFLLISKVFFKTKEDVPVIKIPRVEVISSTAQITKPLLNLSAETKANALTTLRAEIAGKVTEILVDKGKEVNKGQALLKIVDNDRVARLAQAQAAVNHRLAEYNSATKLKTKNFVAENSFLQAKANLEAANAELAHAQYEHEQLTVSSPIQGYYQDRIVEVGDYVSVGDKLATIADLSILTLNVYVSENDIASIKIGQTAKVCIDTFKAQLEAKVTYISKVADPKTHTYLVELTMDNKNLLLPEGLTAKVSLEKDAQTVHILNASVLILDDQGVVGLMIVDADNKAVFRPVELLQATAEKIYVKGLPDTAVVISTGAEFVKNNHVVEPIHSKALS
ncbi:efflux RND transporter periplasmic adaptor subunit [Candidatus Finniella inopinata]|nr:efflux RND transporter periplasmic adaptor subunit [Candidatus Finniella inopinata]